MKLPNFHEAVISKEKIKEYLLSDKHPIGRSKARMFRASGYTNENWEQFADALRDIAERQDVSKIEATVYGERYVVDGDLKLGGKTLAVRTVWFVDKDTQIPHLVTAYPKG